MRRNQLLLTGFATLLTALTFIGTSAMANGRCNFIMQNDYVGPFKACQMPVADDSECQSLGGGADFSGDTCSEGSAVGVCVNGETKTFYYEGDPSALEIGCGFQGGDWNEK